MATTTARKKSATTRARKKPAHPLEANIPAPIEGYVNRLIDGVEDFDLLDYALETQQHVLFAGPTGPGKTYLVYAWCASRGIPLVKVSCRDGIDPATFFGALIQDEDGKIKYVDSEVTEVIEYGGCLLLDEVNMAHQRATAAFHSVLDFQGNVTLLEQNNRVVNVHPELLVVGTYNPGYRGTRPLHQAFRNRWKLKHDIDYDRTVESALVPSPALLDLASNIRDRMAGGTIVTPLSTNMLATFCQHVEDVSFDFATRVLVNGFEPADRGAVEEVFGLYADQIRSDLDAD